MKITITVDMLRSRKGRVAISNLLAQGFVLQVAR